jgi:hypothetical protein
MAGKKLAARVPAKKAKKQLVKQDKEAIGGPKHPRVAAAQRIDELASQMWRAMKPAYYSDRPRGKQAQKAERKLEVAIRAYLKLPKFNGERYDSIIKAEKTEKDRLERIKQRALDKRIAAEAKSFDKEVTRQRASEPIDTKDAETDEEDGRSVQDRTEDDVADESE